jgi:hypothetical protein
MAGILDYQRYIDLFYTVKDVQDHFPEQQLTVGYDFNGQGYDGWTAEIDWQTMIVDELTRDRDNKPVWDSSRVIGVFPKGSKAAIANGVLQFPVDMYTGPILPASNINVPVTLVSFTFTKESDIFSQQFLLIENWMPGHPAGDPVLDENFQPTISENSVLTLTAVPNPVINTEDFVLIAQTNVTLDIPSTAVARFYYNDTGTNFTLLGTSTFVNSTATLALNSEVFGPSTSTFYATWTGYRQYGFVKSNNLEVTILDGIPLDTTLNINPTPTFPGITESATATFVTRPGFQTTASIYIDNTYTFTLTALGNNTGETQVPYTFNGQLVDGEFANTFTITENYVPTTVIGLSNYTVTTATISGNTLNYTANLNKDYRGRLTWKFLKEHKLGGGSATATITVSTSRSLTQALKPLTVSVIDTDANTASNYIWNVSPVRLQAEVNVGAALNNTVGNVEFYADYSPNYNIQNFFLPSTPSLPTTLVNKTINGPRKLQPNQVLIDTYYDNLVGSTFQFPLATDTANTGTDTTVYTVISVQQVVEGALLTLNTATRYSSYSQRYQNTAISIPREYLAAEYTILSTSTFDAINRTTVVEAQTTRPPSDFNRTFLPVGNSQNLYFGVNDGNNLKYLNLATLSNGGASVETLFTTIRVSTAQGGGYDVYSRVSGSWYSTVVRYNAGTKIRSYGSYNSYNTILFNTVVDGALSNTTVDLGTYIDDSPGDRGSGYVSKNLSVGSNYKINPLPEIAREVKIASAEASVKTARLAKFVATDKYNLSSRNGVFDPSMGDIIYVNNTSTLRIGSTFTLTNITTSMSTNSSFSVVGVGQGFVRSDPSWLAHNPALWPDGNSQTISFNVPPAGDGQVYSDTINTGFISDEYERFKITDIDYVGENIPYFNGAYQFNKISIDIPAANEGVTVGGLIDSITGTVFRLAGNTISPFEQQFIVTNIESVGGKTKLTFDPPYTIKSHTAGLTQWQKDNETYRYFLANECNRFILGYTQVNGTAISRVLDVFDYNKLVVDRIPNNVQTGAIIKYNINLGSFNLTVKNVDPVRNIIETNELRDLRSFTNPNLNRLYFENVTTSTSRIFLGTATALTTASNNYVWSLDRQLPAGTYDVIATIVNYIVTGTNATVRYASNSTATYHVESSTGIDAILTLSIDTSNPTFDQITLTSAYLNAATSDHFYVFSNPVRFYNNSILVATNPWTRVGTSFTQRSIYTAAKNTINADTFYIEWDGSLDFEREYNDQLLYNPAIIYLTPNRPSNILLTFPGSSQILRSDRGFNISAAVFLGTGNNQSNTSLIKPTGTVGFDVEYGTTNYQTGVWTPSGNYQFMGNSTISSGIATYLVLPNQLSNPSGIEKFNFRARYLGDVNTDSTSTVQQRAVQNGSYNYVSNDFTIFEHSPVTNPYENGNPNVDWVDLNAKTTSTQGVFTVVGHTPKRFVISGNYNVTLYPTSAGQNLLPVGFSLGLKQTSNAQLTAGETSLVSAPASGDFVTITTVSNVNSVVTKNVQFQRSVYWPNTIISGALPPPPGNWATYSTYFFGSITAVPSLKINGIPGETQIIVGVNQNSFNVSGIQSTGVGYYTTQFNTRNTRQIFKGVNLNLREFTTTQLAGGKFGRVKGQFTAVFKQLSPGPGSDFPRGYASPSIDVAVLNSGNTAPSRSGDSVTVLSQTSYGDSRTLVIEFTKTFTQLYNTDFTVVIGLNDNTRPFVDEPGTANVVIDVQTFNFTLV